MDKETEINQLLKHLRDGKAGSHLEPVIRSIRDYLKNINQIARSSGGAIIFFHKKRTEGSTLMMQVFPFKNNLPVFNGETVLTSEQQVVLLEKINSEKAYTFFWHFEKFSVNYNTAKHLDAEVPEQNRLKYDEHKVEYHIIDPK
ncbi:MAG: hypothetical protein JNM68_08935, partial [Dinghuibacter sp.]|nr:hypothetical protein [Dinghuibacter sp.]